jgi:hypothetical protein
VDGRTSKGRSSETNSDALYEEIGRLKVELDWLKKNIRQKNLWVSSGSGSLPSE